MLSQYFNEHLWLETLTISKACRHEHCERHSEANDRIWQTISVSY